MTRRQSRKTQPRAFETVDHFLVVASMGVGGATVKDILQDPTDGRLYIAKLGRRNSDLEVMTEYAIYLVGRSIGIRVAPARIARYRGGLRFLSQYFLDQSAAEELVHGVQLFKELYDEKTVGDVLGKESKEQAFFTVQSVKSAFGAHYVHYGAGIEDDLFGDFVAMLTHDALIGVQDRHHENWGVIVRREVGANPPRFAPLYDSARGLFCSYTESQLTQRFGGPVGLTRLDEYIAKSRPLVGFDGLKPNRGRRYVTHTQLLAAVFRQYPTQRARISSILQAYDWLKVRSDLKAHLRGPCSAHRMTLMLTCLRRRQRALGRAIHG